MELRDCQGGRSRGSELPEIMGKTCNIVSALCAQRISSTVPSPLCELGARSAGVFLEHCKPRAVFAQPDSFCSDLVV